MTLNISVNITLASPKERSLELEQIQKSRGEFHQTSRDVNIIYPKKKKDNKRGKKKAKPILR